MSWLLSPVGAVSSIDHVGDVTISAVVDGELLRWNGTKWVNNTLAEAGVAAASHTHVIADVTDFTDNSTNWDTAYGWGDWAGHAHTASDVTDFDTEVSNNASVSANTAKVTNATHTGDVTGSTALTIAAGAVDVAMLANGTDGELITWDAAGAPATVGVGTATHVLTSNGAGAAPTFQAVAGGGGIDNIGQFRGASNVNITTTEATMDLTSESYDPDGNYALSTDVITITAAGWYVISYNLGASVDGGGGTVHDDVTARVTLNGTTTELLGSEARSYINEGGSGNRPDTSVGTTFVYNFTALDTIRIRAKARAGTDLSQWGNETYLTIYRIQAP